MKDKQKQRSLEDIPEALRDIPLSPTVSSLNPKWIIVGLVGVVMIVLGTLGIMRLVSSPPQTNTVSVEPTPSPSPTPEPPKKVENILGHLPYEEADPSQLKAITNDGKIKLRIKAADSNCKKLSAAFILSLILPSLVIAFYKCNEMHEQVALF